MPKRIRYDLEAEWDDPCEPRASAVEKRVAPRAQAKFHIKISLNLVNKPRPLVGPGLVENISAAGLFCRTKHRLSPGQWVSLYLPTKVCPPEMGLPPVFMGDGEVIRTLPLDERVQQTAFRFDEALAEDIQLAIFVDYLQTLGGVSI